MVKKFTLVTGASSGIGAAITKTLSKEHRLILTGRNLEALIDIRENCFNSKEHLIWHFDFNKISDLSDELNKFIKTNDLSVENFVHSAGITKVLPIRLFSSDIIEEVFNVNFFSAVEISRTLIKKSINNKSLKNIVFISSVSSISGTSGYNIYSASKGALDSFMKSLAIELAPEIRVNCILPGAIETKMTAKMLEDSSVRMEINKQHLLGIGNTDDVANMVEFLISDSAKWITGQQFIVDGGKTAH